MNKYEEIIRKVTNNTLAGKQKWHLVECHPNFLKSLEDVIKVYATSLSNSLELWIYSYNSLSYLDDFDKWYTKENIMCSLVNSGIEIDSFGTDSVSRTDLQYLLDKAGYTTFDVDNDISSFLND